MKDIGFKEFYKMQMNFQERIMEEVGYNGERRLVNLPIDDVSLMSYHLIALLEESGELVKSDKRWKNFRNTHFDKDNKLEEVADCIITLFNICAFSGITPSDLEDALYKKIENNNKRLDSK